MYYQYTMRQTKIEKAEVRVQKQYGMTLLEYAKQQCDAQQPIARVARELGLNRQELERYLLGEGYRLRKYLEPIHPALLKVQE